MPCAYCLPAIVFMLQFWLLHNCTSVIIIWNEHIKLYMCWLCLVQISVPSLPNVFKSSVWDDIQYMPNASSLGKSNMSTCPAFITIAQYERNNGPEANMSNVGRSTRHIHATSTKSYLQIAKILTIALPHTVRTSRVWPVLFGRRSCHTSTWSKSGGIMK